MVETTCDDVFLSPFSFIYYFFYLSEHFSHSAPDRYWCFHGIRSLGVYSCINLQSLLGDNMGNLIESRTDRNFIAGFPFSDTPCSDDISHRLRIHVWLVLWKSTAVSSRILAVLFLWSKSSCNHVCYVFHTGILRYRSVSYQPLLACVETVVSWQQRRFCGIEIRAIIVIQCYIIVVAAQLLSVCCFRCTTCVAATMQPSLTIPKFKRLPPQFMSGRKRKYILPSPLRTSHLPPIRSNRLSGVCEFGVILWTFLV